MPGGTVVLALMATSTVVNSSQAHMVPHGQQGSSSVLAFDSSACGFYGTIVVRFSPARIVQKKRARSLYGTQTGMDWSCSGFKACCVRGHTRHHFFVVFVACGTVR